MFIEKKELKNSLELYKIRCREERFPRLILCAFPFLLFILDFFSVITQLFKYSDQITYLSLETYSLWCSFYMLALSVVMVYWYRKSNREHEILPQTNKSRFLSYVIYNYMFYIKISILSLVLYLIQYAVISLIGKNAGNIHLAYNFSLNFILWGFIVNLIYGFLAISLIIFLGTLDRRFGINFRISTCIFLFIVILNAEFLVKYIMNFLSFLTKEPSLILFCLKGVCLWLIISAISWIINSHTVYFKTLNSMFSQKVIAGTGIVTVFVIVANIVVMNMLSYNSLIEKEVYLSVKEMKNSIEKKVNIPLETSHLKEGDTIKVVTNCNFEKESLYITPIHSEDYGFTGTGITSIHFNNEKVTGLALVYTPPINLIHHLDMITYTNPELTAELNGTTLYLNYEYHKNQKLLYLSPYSFMRQFETFKDKNYFSRVIGTVGSTNGGEIFILAGKGIQISLPSYKLE